MSNVVIHPSRAFVTALDLMGRGYAVETGTGRVLGPMDDEPDSFLGPRTYGPQGNIRQLRERVTGHLVRHVSDHEPPPDSAA